MAMIISTVYGLVMMAVVVGIALQIKEDGPLAPASMFFFVFAGELIIAGLLHPREINCLPAMLIYYITVPSMYMLLILYSLFNMNNISWGTREAPVTPGADKTKKVYLEEEGRSPLEPIVKTNTLRGYPTLYTYYTRDRRTGGYCCSGKPYGDDKLQQAIKRNRLQSYTSQLESVLRDTTTTDKYLPHCTEGGTKAPPHWPLACPFQGCAKWPPPHEIEEEKKKAEEEAKLKKKKKPFFGFLQGNNKSPEEEGSIEFSLAGLFKCMLCTHPKSVDDKLQLARIAESINSIGRRIEMIERRIDPTVPSRRRGSMSINGHTVSLQEEPEEEDSYSDSIEDMGGEVVSEQIYQRDITGECVCLQKKLEKGLREMRNKYVFAFIMLNSLFVLAIFLLQLNQDQMHISWPLGAKSSISFNSTSNEACTHFTLSLGYFRDGALNPSNP
uniref:Uncharacterized protein n=1 Tax=Timema douglasi TaxID=61478 RepID=A0A7R8VGW6_TIMDO|nr:unnamed protein product [Timema douglasi]